MRSVCFLYDGGFAVFGGHLFGGGGGGGGSRREESAQLTPPNYG